MLCLDLLSVLNIRVDNIRCSFKIFKEATVFCQDYGSCTMECVSGDWFGEVKVDLADLMQESADVCCVLI